MGASSLYTIAEVGELLRVGRTTVYKLITDGELFRIKIGRRALVTSDSVEMLIERCRQAESPKA